jgi:drug/metabolite transporter (DMT)-like permease
MTPATTTPVQRRNAYLAWATICLVWGTTYLGIKVALESIPPFLMGGLRYIIAGSILAAFLRLQGKSMPPWNAMPGFLLSGALLLGVGNGGVIWAEMHVPSGLAAVMIAATPFWMTGVESLLPNGDRLTRRSMFGLLVGFSGILLLVWPDLKFDAAGGWQFTAGVIALQLACLGWVLGSSYSKYRRGATDPITASAFQMLLGGGVMLLAGTLHGEWSVLAFTPRTTAALVYLIVAGSLVGFVAYIYALTHLSPSFVSLYAYVNPVVAVALGTLVLGEPFGWRLTLAIAIILSGMAIVTTKRSKAAPSTTSASSDKTATSEKVESATSVSVERGEKRESAA